MREPPADFDIPSVCASLRAAYGLAVRDVTFVPFGHDALAWSFRVETTDATPYFLKARREIRNEAGLLVPRFLREQGAAEVVAPIPAHDGALWTRAGAYALILYPFVDGHSGIQRPLTATQWEAYGALLRRIHDTEVPPSLADRLRREAFWPDGAEMLRRVDAAISGRVPAALPDDAPAADLVGCWRDQRRTIMRVLDGAEALGRRLSASAPAAVLCHADIHTGNVLGDAAGRIWFVDWDEVMLAPRERDLMFALGGGISRRLVGPHQEALFLQGYLGGDAATIGAAVPASAPATDPLGLAYYRYAWAVSDIGAFGEEVLLRPDLGLADRMAGARLFRSLFAPGEIVSLALDSTAT